MTDRSLRLPGMSAIAGDSIYGRFGRLSADYDAARRGSPPATINFVLRQLAGHPLVLDLACGTGTSTRQLAAGGCELVGCDIDPLMLHYAVARALARDRFVIGRAEAIPFGDNVFDAVTCFCGYHWFDPARALPEMLRVLRASGRVVIANLSARDGLYDDYRKLVAQFVPGELPDHRKTYDPRRDLAVHGLRVVAEHSTSDRFISTAPELHQSFQSVSVWNLIPEDRLADASEALMEFCSTRTRGATTPREIVYETIIAGR
jgi:ubiquinone/menaquinone biosynthesis C-methylase UbiE